MPHLVVGTAGHIDHGKSALVLALTGTDPDRLKEEKRRGITIELGFADLKLGDDRVVSLIDVPGHERFVRHMVAGATGIDAVVLVVAADQGVQPQTREHLEICSLLQVRRGIVVLSKCDLVDDDLRQVAAMELEELLAGTFLEQAPILSVSAHTGAGLDDLRAALSELVDSTPRRSSSGVARLPIDRSFVLKGFGTVVTGTLVSGTFSEGQEIEILPVGLRARVRGLQVHGHETEAATAGRRIAVNLQGVDCTQVPRGSTLSQTGHLTTTRRVWARLRLLPSAPRRLLRGGPVRLHQGTADVAARMRVFGETSPGCLDTEFLLEEPMVLMPGDRFILRRPAPVDTVGGGEIVDAFPARNYRQHAAVFAEDSLDPAVAVGLRIRRAGSAGCGADQLRRQLGHSVAELDGYLEGLRSSGSAVSAGALWVDGEIWQAIGERCLEEIRAFHASDPLRTGVARQALRSAVEPSMPQELWRDRLEALRQEGRIRLEGERVSTVEHQVEMSDEDSALSDGIERKIREAGFEAPGVGDVVDPTDTQRAAPILELLLAQGTLVRLPDGSLVHGETLERLDRMLAEYARESETIDVAAFKRITGVSRKHAIPLLEHLDAIRTTRRVGNVRQILPRNRE